MIVGSIAKDHGTLNVQNNLMNEPPSLTPVITKYVTYNILANITKKKTKKAYRNAFDFIQDGVSRYLDNFNFLPRIDKNYRRSQYRLQYILFPLKIAKSRGKKKKISPIHAYIILKKPNVK